MWLVKSKAMTGLTNALCFLAEKHVTARSESLAYIRPHPRSFEVAGVQRSYTHIEERLQDIKVPSDHILSP